MTFEKLVSGLKFDTGEAEELLKLNKNIEKSYPELYGKLLDSYLVSIEKCIEAIQETATKVCIYEETLGLWLVLKLAADRMYPKYKSRGIDNEYFFAAVLNVHRYITASRLHAGRFGIIISRYVRAFCHLIELRAFRIGDFNFEFIKFDSEIYCNGESLHFGDTCLSMHVPVNTDISRENVDRNFSLAREFFRKHFDMEKPFCQIYSWLIHPSIKESLPEDSKLVEFYKRFTIYEVKNNPGAVIEYVFGMKFFEEYKLGNKNYEAYPEKTSLQKKFKERLIKGLSLGVAKGVALL